MLERLNPSRSGVFEGLELFPQPSRGSSYAARFFALVNSYNQFCNPFHIWRFHSPSSRLVRPEPDSMIHYHVCFLQFLRKPVHVLFAMNVEEDLVRLSESIVCAFDR